LGAPYPCCTIAFIFRPFQDRGWLTGFSAIGTLVPDGPQASIDDSAPGPRPVGSESTYIPGCRSRDETGVGSVTYLWTQAQTKKR
jgi:hypothetical protein